MGIFNAFQHYLAAYSITAESRPRVTLPGYGSLTGTTINTTLTGHPLPTPVHAWLGIDYASQPVGEDRFKPVGPPLSIGGNAGQKDTSQYGKVCIQDERFIGYEQDEACLNMNVFRPVGIEIDEKLPVLVWIHGGGFVSGSGRSFDGASFVASSKSPLMAVTFNYRINSLGFLPSPLFEKEGLLNLGLLDQVQLLKFVQQYISSFGGDPSKVTLGGRSAGGHSVGMHYFSNNTNDTTLFSKAILQSGSVTGRSFPNSYYPLYLTQFTEYLSIINCNNTNETLACLRKADINKIRAASSKLFADSEYAITWPFQPTLGAPLLEQPGSRSGIEKKFYRLPLITTNVNDEAKLYTPGNLSSNADFLQFMKTLLPSLNTTDLSLLESLYPDPDPSNPQTGGNSPYANSPNSTQYNRLSAATSDYQYICPGQETAFRASTEEIPTWKLRFNTNSFFPEWQGIPHTSDTKYTWNAPVGDVEYPDVGEILHGYFASFVVEGDPNLLRKEGSPVWPRYRVGDGGVVGVGRQLVIEPDETRVEVDDIRREQCAFWRDPERAGRLHK